LKKQKRFRNRSFSTLEPDLIESTAFLTLPTTTAYKVLIRFHQKARKPNRKERKKGKDWARTIKNQGQIIFTYAEARELEIKSSATFHRAIRELVEVRGFIDIVDPGNWYFREPTRYAISWRWEKYGMSEYKPMKVPRRLPMGIGFQKGVNPKKIRSSLSPVKH
jgi:hypothetical protein